MYISILDVTTNLKRQRKTRQKKSEGARTSKSEDTRAMRIFKFELCVWQYNAWTFSSPQW